MMLILLSIVVLLVMGCLKMSEIRAPRKAAIPWFSLSMREMPIVGLVSVAESVESVARQMKCVDPVSFEIGTKENVSLDHVLMVARREDVIE